MRIDTPVNLTCSLCNLGISKFVICKISAILKVINTNIVAVVIRSRRQGFDIFYRAAASGIATRTTIQLVVIITKLTTTIK